MHFRGLVLFASILFCALVAQALAQLPGFEIVDVTNDTHRNQFAGGFNNCGQIAYSKRFDNVSSAEEVFVYDNGRSIQITNDTLNDRLVDINNAGTIVWTRFIPPSGSGHEVAVFQDGEMFLLTNDDVSDAFPRINDLGHVAWSRGTFGSEDIMFYDGKTIRQISDNDLANEFARLNDNDVIGWTRIDFDALPFTAAEPMLHADGETLELTDGSFFQPILNGINAVEQVVWVSKDPVTFQRRIHLWEDGKSSMITDDGKSPRLNNLGDIVFNRDGPDGFLKGWLYHDGEFTQLTDEPFHSGASAINDWQEVVLGKTIALPVSNWRLMRRIRTGEADFDGHIDLRDFAAFQNCMTGSGDFDGTDGGFDRLCDCRFLDIDRDVDADDFALFQPAMDGPL